MRTSDLRLLLAPCVFLGATTPLRAGEELQCRVLKPEGGILSIAVSADSRWLVAGSGGVWDLEAWKVLRRWEDAHEPAALSPAGKTLALGAKNSRLRVWDLTSDAELRQVECLGPESQPFLLAHRCPSSRCHLASSCLPPTLSSHRPLASISKLGAEPKNHAPAAEAACSSAGR